MHTGGREVTYIAIPALRDAPATRRALMVSGELRGVLVRELVSIHVVWRRASWCLISMFHGQWSARIHVAQSPYTRYLKRAEPLVDIRLPVERVYILQIS